MNLRRQIGYSGFVTISQSGYPQRRGTARSVSPRVARERGPRSSGLLLLMTVLTVVVASVVRSFGWLLLAIVSLRWSNNVAEECQHNKRMMVNNVIYCLQCAMYLYSGRCPKCNHPLDNHANIGTPEQLCPTDGGIAVR